MSVNHLVSFFISSVNNAGKVKKKSVEFLYSKVLEGICKILLEEGFIKGYEVFAKPGSENIKMLRVELAYHGGSFVIKEFAVVSKPGSRVYSNASSLKAFYDGLGFVILSTNKGILTDRAAKLQNVGGEVLCTVF